MIVLPVPIKVKPPAPENTPERVALPKVGCCMTLLLATLNTALELSPPNNTKVPPDNVGLALREASPALVPVEMFEILVLSDDEFELLPELQTLHAVISRFHVPDPDDVSVKANV